MSTRAPARKIWIAVDALERSGDVLGAVTRFAAGPVVELAGLFVEDVDLVTLAGWPAATETRLFEAAARPFGSAELEATLRAHAAALQRRLDALAREIGVPWSFRTVRGHIVQQALSLAGGDDWIVLASATTSVQLRAAPLRTVARPVLWLLPDDEQGLAQLQEVAARYDPLGSAERRVVLLADARGAAAIRASVEREGGGLRSATQAELAQWIACAPRTTGGLVLMTRAAGAADPERLRQLLRRGAALVLV